MKEEENHRIGGTGVCLFGWLVKEEETTANGKKMIYRRKHNKTYLGILILDGGDVGKKVVLEIPVVGNDGGDYTIDNSGGGRIHRWWCGLQLVVVVGGGGFNDSGGDGGENDSDDHGRR
ncbi:hypothetical protein L6452_18257 [Arctium lappa]|uniref:Uncharacterized protein n=1 Tax=Arctium lappa TaxID=4217 RepID=A0ACB9C5Q3_ARCLA|nr:hypothetical protein L6452_18257 [Arctium lappa]